VFSGAGLEGEEPVGFDFWFVDDGLGTDVRIRGLKVELRSPRRGFVWDKYWVVDSWWGPLKGLGMGAKKVDVGTVLLFSIMGAPVAYLMGLVLFCAVVSPVQRVFFPHEVSYQTWRAATSAAIAPCEAASVELNSASAGLVKGGDSVAQEVTAVTQSHRVSKICGELWANVGVGFWDGLEAWAQPPGPAAAPNINALVWTWELNSVPRVAYAVREMVLYQNPVGAVLKYDNAANAANKKAAYINKLSEHAADGARALKLPMWPIYYEAGVS
jgi:hypothetical protein